MGKLSFGASSLNIFSLAGLFRNTFLTDEISLSNNRKSLQACSAT